LETVPIANDRNLVDMRFPVQYVIRPDLDFRGFAGQLASGVIRKGDPVTVLPSRRTSRVKSIVTWDGELDEAFAPMSVTVCLEDEIDVSRGDMLVPSDNLPALSGHFEATVVWMNEKPLQPHYRYLLKHASQIVPARVLEILCRMDVNTLEEGPAEKLQLNEIARVTLRTQKPLPFDPYQRNRAAGNFVLIDAISNETVGIGMIRRPCGQSAGGEVSADERVVRIGHPPFIVHLDDGGREIALEIERYLFDLGYLTYVAENTQASTQEAGAALRLGAALVLYGPGPLIPGLPSAIFRVSTEKNAWRHALNDLAGRLTAERVRTSEYPA
jgi:hypothetical protein